MGEPCACLTEEAQGLIATCPSRGGDCQPLSRLRAELRPQTCSFVVYRLLIDALARCSARAMPNRCPTAPRTRAATFAVA